MRKTAPKDVKSTKQYSKNFVTTYSLAFCATYFHITNHIRRRKPRLRGKCRLKEYFLTWSSGNYTIFKITIETNWDVRTRDLSLHAWRKRKLLPNFLVYNINLWRAFRLTDFPVALVGKMDGWISDGRLVLHCIQISRISGPSLCNSFSGMNTNNTQPSHRFVYRWSKSKKRHAAIHKTECQR